MKHIHKDFRKGKRVLVILRNGERIVGKFISNNSLGITIDSCGHIKNKDIRAITIYKGDRVKEGYKGFVHRVDYDLFVINPENKDTTPEQFRDCVFDALNTINARLEYLERGSAK